jgi:RND family efflux transporter MFP subunit
MTCASYIQSGPALLAALVLASTGCDRTSVAQTQAQATPAAADRPLDRVTAGPPVRKTLELYTTQPGRLEAFETTPLAPKVAGYVEEILVDIGDRVQAGELLLKLSVPELHDEFRQKQALVAQSEAEVRQAQAAVRAAEAARATAEALVAQAQAGTMRADADYERWKSEYERMNDLAGSGSVTRKLVDEALNQFRAADAARQEVEAEVASVRAALNQSEANLEKAKADEVAARARLRVAQANLARTQTMLGYTEIKAPFDGVITRRSVDTAHFVQPASGSGSQPLLVVARRDRLRVFVDVPELEAPFVDAGESGDPVTIRIQALPGPAVEGRVTRTSWALDASNRSLRTEIDLPNPEGRLRPGMYATVQILLERREEVLTLPAAAIVREAGQTLCCTVESGRIRRQPVTTGLRAGADVEILSGLDGDETVVLVRADSLEEDRPVEVIPAQKQQ